MYSNGGKDKLAVQMLASGYDPGLAGYGPHQTALIERAIYEFASRRNIQVWREDFDRETKKHVLSPGLGPCVTCDFGRPYVVQLHIKQPEPYVLEAQQEVGEHDLVLNWYDVNLDEVSHLAKKSELDVSIGYAEGLHHFFASDDDAETFGSIISRWQNHRRGISRLMMFLFYAASLGLFAGFLWLQTEIVFRALGWV
jgi:hypothetical protein